MGRLVFHAARPALAIVVFFWVLDASADPARTEFFQGVATRLDDKPEFSEVHEMQWQNPADPASRLISKYFDPDGKLIAECDSNLTTGLTLASYHFKDLRQNTESGLLASPDGSLELIRQRFLSDPVERKVIPRDPEYVTFQGLFFLIQNHLRDPNSPIYGEDGVPIRMLMPLYFDDYGLRVRALPRDPQNPVTRVRVEIRSWLLRLFAPSIEVEYDRGLQRIVGYNGPTIILRSDGTAQKVNVRYLYH